MSNSNPVNLATRKSACKRGYGRAWQEARRAWLQLHPFCAEHERGGVLVAATDVDHIIPHRGNATLFWDCNNWQSLCHRCHSAKTAAQDMIRKLKCR